MTVWLTPDRKPFYGGTYFPARDGDRGTRTGFLTLLKQQKQRFETNPQAVRMAAQRLTQTVRRRLNVRSPLSSSQPSPVMELVTRYYGQFDHRFGGTKRAPKFPSTLPIRVLLRHHRKTNDRRALKMAETTLIKMAEGGIYDQVGGGFHRYSTDKKWLVPHFEKMLYDNALLARTYTEGYLSTGNKYFGEITQDILDYILKEMTAPHGGFYSATDADSLTPSNHREEGWFFTWTIPELQALLTQDQMEAVRRRYGVTETGNFEGRNILHIKESKDRVANSLNVSIRELEERLRRARGILYEARTQRPAPILDRKSITAWNGMMIGALAHAGFTFERPDYLRAAQKAADFVLKELVVDGRLMRSFFDGTVKYRGYLDDYAFLIDGLLTLFEATGQSKWLERSMALEKTLHTHFEDKVGGFFMTAKDHETLIAREKPSYDGAIPSGNSVHALNLLRLYALTTDDRYRQRAELLFGAFSKSLTDMPSSLSQMFLATDFREDRVKEILIVVPKGQRALASPFLSHLRSGFVPNCVLVVAEEERLTKLSRWVPWVEGKRMINNTPTAYVCEAQVCQKPTTSPLEFARQLGLQ